MLQMPETAKQESSEEKNGKTSSVKTENERRRILADLRRMIKSVPAERTAPKPVPKDNTKIKLDEIIAGTYMQTPAGYCFVYDETYSMHHYQGIYSFSNLLKTPHEHFKFLAKQEIPSTFLPGKAVYFDTETTGLSGGAGAYVFLAGMGWFEDRFFRIRQFFMRDYNEEPAFLWAVGKLLNKFDSIVTYNGKVYDLPLLESRFISNRMDEYSFPAFHLDLLFPARRFWKERFKDCSLGALEMKVLNFNRIKDIPGALIPKAYFDYVRTKNAGLIQNIFIHNRDDVLSLAALTGCLLDKSNPDNSKKQHAAEIFGLARSMEQFGNTQKAAELYRYCLTQQIDDNLLKKIALRLWKLMKARGCEEELIPVMKNIAFPDPDVSAADACIELAKYYEHKAKDYGAAIRHTRTAMEYVKNFDGGKQEKYMENLKHRSKRILAKLEGKKWR